MFTRLWQGILYLLVTTWLVTCNYFPTQGKTQASSGETNLEFNAPADGIGPIFAQPVDATGKLLLSSWLDPDGSDNDKYRWDNFTLQSTETIVRIDWVGGYDPTRFGGGGPVLDFSVDIYPSIAAGTEPAVANPPLVHYQTAGNATETSIGIVGGTPMYIYSFSLPVQFVASAGVKYWVQIEAFQHGSVPDWGIASGSGGNGSHYLKESGAGGDIMYRSAPGDAAITLLGPIPVMPNAVYLPVISS